MMAPVSESERAELRRQQVLDAAAQCFRASGFHGASMAEIARTAGMSPGHIYNLFENKEELIGAIVARDQALWLDKATAMLREPDVAQAMIDGVAAGVDETTALPAAALRLEVAAEAGRNPKLAAVVQAAEAASRERCEMLLQSALAQRGVQLDPATLRARGVALAAIFDGLMVRSVRDPAMDKPALVREIQRLVRMLIDD
ncbi:TetR/AcrR family transcriptional regulator [Azohydromonas caseinilytica]|uniref:TetR/AcrR family transcriptional regulator n=1 Tax=Azohydromonas caseinilytica TaxID=2728836 RepID=A0A848FBZ6_9BURK|nr:TetR/AcrR family transcriptional regulator [Azohydromonas caseinilytica]NML16842.1 TetR/AcrR family transcriptional regulator [Azohydromonas caseinilytica]